MRRGAMSCQAVTYCIRCISYQSSSESRDTSWQFWRTRFGSRPLRFTCTTESRNVSAVELCVHLPSRCWSNRSPGDTFLGVLSGFQHRLSVITRCHKHFWLAILCLFLNQYLNLYIHPGFHWTHATGRQRFWSYDRMALYKFHYYYYYYYCYSAYLFSLVVTVCLIVCTNLLLL